MGHKHNIYLPDDTLLTIAFSPNGELYISGQEVAGDNIQKLNADGTTTTILQAYMQLHGMMGVKHLL